MLARMLYIGQIINLTAASFILGFAIFYQLAFHDLACPLCLLQRLGFIGVGLGYVLNLQIRFDSSHYAVIYLSSLFILVASLLQIFFHIAPNDPGFGDAIFGLHFYTWSYILTLYFIFSSSCYLLINQQFNSTVAPTKITQRLINVISYIFLAIIILNTISTFLECGFLPCPGNPVEYIML